VADPDRTAFEQEALAMLDGTYRLARWLVPRESDARDLVQETYLHALEARSTFRPGASMRAWLCQILRNCFVDHCRRRGHEVLWTDGQDERRALESRADRQAEFFGDEELARLTTLVRGDIGRALQALPENHRTVVLLCDVERWRWEEAAAALHVPIGTVQSRLFRARRVLRELLSEYAPEEAPVERVR
jgi:RNA polymerase sigma factor (sigma-70 family)